MRRVIATIERLRSVVGLAVVAKAIATCIGEIALVISSKTVTLTIVHKTMVAVVVEAMLAIIGKTAVAEVAATDARTAIAGETTLISMPCEARPSRPSIKATNPAIIDVIEMPAAEVVVATVVAEAAVIPVATVEASAEVAKAIVDAAIVANGWTPITCIPKVAAITPAPITRSPKSIDVRRLNPGSIDPLVTVTSPGPIAWSPYVTIAGDRWLSVYRYRRRSDSHGHKDACVRRARGSKQKRTRDRNDAD